MTILALEFSSSQRSVALARDGAVLSEVVESGERGVAAFAMIGRVLAESKLELEQVGMICVGLGPGSYTGIRATISIAQGWQLAREIKLAGVSSVEAIVEQARGEKIFGRVGIVIDAQRNEFYLAKYEVADTGIRQIEPLKIVTRAEVEMERDEILIGPEITRWFPNGRNLFPKAGPLARIVARNTGSCFDEKLEPIYLRETSFVKATRVENADLG
ncbi:MAG: tRNA (adenosine(37)-N6)-threonylcarbamoyltransferase complex dimerization subunit type 1 TsaB [Limisphaerales bacterium]